MEVNVQDSATSEPRLDQVIVQDSLSAINIESPGKISIRSTSIQIVPNSFCTSEHIGGHKVGSEEVRVTLPFGNESCEDISEWGSDKENIANDINVARVEPLRLKTRISRQKAIDRILEACTEGVRWS